MAVQVANTSSQLSGKTVVTAEDVQTLSGAKTLSAKLTTNGQVQFPAAQAASADPNCLDDYEEGTWTPSLKFGGNAVGMTYSLQSGRYTKIGRLVVLECQVTLTAKGSSTGTPTITGMPFNAGATGATGAIDSATGISSLTAGLYVVCDNAGVLYLFGNGASGRLTLSETNFSNTSTFTFSFSYFV